MKKSKQTNLDEKKLQVQKLIEEIDLKLNIWYFPYSMELKEIKRLFDNLLKITGHSKDKIQTNLFLKNN